MALMNGISNGEHRGMLKVEGGKLLKVKLSVSEGCIASIRFTGDFFIHPEENIEELEESLIGRAISKEELLPVLSNFFFVNEVVGAGPEDFVSLVLSACSCSGKDI